MKGMETTMRISSKRRTWRREPWVWFLILFPATAVVAGFFTLYLAISSDDGLVVDDYYKKGKEINRVLSRDYAAAKHGLSGELAIDNAEGVVMLQLSAREYSLPGEVVLSVLHPTRGGLDRTVTLADIGQGRYRGVIPPLVQGRWYVQLEADDWRLTGALRVPDTRVLSLVPVLSD